MKEKIETLVRDFLQKEAYNLYHLAFTKELGMAMLRIEIEESLSLDKLSELTNELDKLLEPSGILNDNVLEVSSAGIERILYHEKHYDKALGEKVFIKTKKATYQGIFDHYDEDYIFIKNKEDLLMIKRKEIKLIRLTIEF